MNITNMISRTTLRTVSVLAIIVCPIANASGQTTVWTENWEDDAWGDRWSIEGTSAWEVGTPISGPLGGAYEGERCAATVLTGNYSASESTRLIRGSFEVPPAEMHPRLRLWHWFAFGSGDSGTIQLRVPGQAWESISSAYTGLSDGWFPTSIDLDFYAGQTVELGFFFSSNSAATTVNRGWYIDRIELRTGPDELPLNTRETFDEWGEWSVTNGIWELGEAVLGPNDAPSSGAVAGTGLDRNYPVSKSSFLASPSFRVPPASEDPRLRYWSWHSFNSGDFGEVWVVSTGTTERISTRLSGSSHGWHPAEIDLTPYSGAEVSIGFLMTSDFPTTTVDRGWYVDDVEIRSGLSEFPLNTPIDFENASASDFAAGWNDWFATLGLWEIGEPLLGPESARSGRYVAGTGLDRNYPISTSASLRSPSFRVPPAGQSPRLRLWSWYAFGAGDFGEVWIVGEGTSERLSGRFSGSSHGWHPIEFDLSPYSGAEIHFSFFVSTDFPTTTVDRGWYLDDVELRTGEPVLDVPVTFEDSEWNDWWTLGGGWEIGTARLGPAGLPKVAGTLLERAYGNGFDSYLVSPRFRSSPGSELRFRSWHDLGTGDQAIVYVRLADGSTSEVLATLTGNSSEQWVDVELDFPILYQNVEVEILFRLVADNNNSIGAGWYVDDVAVTPLASSDRPFRRADADVDDEVNITDAIVMLTYLFIDSDPSVVPCEKAIDVDDNGKLQITDPVYLLGSLFLDGAPPLPPFLACGVDPSDDLIPCGSFPLCP